MDALSKRNAIKESPSTDLRSLAKKIVSLLPDHDTLTVSQIVTRTQRKPSTVRLHLKELVEKGYLMPRTQGHGAQYV